MNTLTKSLHDGASASGHFAGQALDAAEHALDSTRHLTTQAFGKASKTARDMRSGVKDLAGRGIDGMSDAAAATQKQLTRYADASGRYVAEQPLKSTLIAAAVGAGVAALVIFALQRGSGRY